MSCDLLVFDLPIILPPALDLAAYSMYQHKNIAKAFNRAHAQNVAATYAIPSRSELPSSRVSYK